MKNLFVMTFVAGLAVTASIGCSAATPDQACGVWSSMAQKMAEGRDSGVPYKEQLKKIEALKGRPGLTDANLVYARGVVTAVYKDFPKKSPDDLAILVNATCLLQNSK